MKIAQIPSRKRKQSILIIILVVGLPILLFAAYQVTQIISKASGGTDPKNIVLSNLTAYMTTISWTTDSKTNGTIQLLENDKVKLEAKDLRGTEKRYTHYVELTGLEPNTQYKFRIKSDNKEYSSSEEKELKFRTAPITTFLPPPNPVSGDISQVSNDDVLIFLVLQDNPVATASTVLKNSKTWFMDLSVLLKSTGESQTMITDGTRLTILATNGGGKSLILKDTYSNLFDSNGRLKDPDIFFLKDDPTLDIYAEISDQSKLVIDIPSPDDPIPVDPIPVSPTPDKPTPINPVPDNSPANMLTTQGEESNDIDYEFTNREYRIVTHLKWQELVTRAPVKFTNVGPTSIRLTNLTDSGFTVLWVSEKKESGSVRFGTSPTELDQTAYDVRDNITEKGKYYVHNVALSRLRKETKYYYEIISGDDVYDNNEKKFTVTTLPITETAPPYISTSGKVLNLPEHGEAYLIASIRDDDLTGSSESSNEVSTKIDNNGNWTLTVADMRTKDGLEYFEYTDGDTLMLEVYTTSKSSIQEESMEGIDKKTIEIKLQDQGSSAPVTVVSQLSSYGITNDPTVVGIPSSSSSEIPKTGVFDSFVGIIMIASSISLSGILVYILARKDNKKNDKMSKNL